MGVTFLDVAGLVASRLCGAWQGRSGQGRSGQGVAGRGEARQGEARQGKASFFLRKADE